MPHHTTSGQAITPEVSYGRQRGGRCWDPARPQQQQVRSPPHGCPPFLRTHRHLATARRNLQHTSKASQRCFFKKNKKPQNPSKHQNPDLGGSLGCSRWLPESGRGPVGRRQAGGRKGHGAGSYRPCGLRAEAQHDVCVIRRQTDRGWPTSAGRRGRRWSRCPSWRSAPGCWRGEGPGRHWGSAVFPSGLPPVLAGSQPIAGRCIHLRDWCFHGWICS